MQWLTADIVFDGYDFQTNFYIGLDKMGRICEIVHEKPSVPVVELKGLLMPGMVNAHCHLELSHTKGMIEEKIGLSNFLQKVSEVIPNKVQDEVILMGMKNANEEMWENGIIAVGDICNTNKSISIKQESNIKYHNFVECITIREQDTVKRFTGYNEVYKQFLSEELSSSLALHTPYTCNEGLYKLVNEHSDFISIHNQESEAENSLFERKNGEFDDFYKHFGLDKSEIIKDQTCDSSFENSHRLLSSNSKKLFVHNTFTREQDLKLADDNTWFCFCPKANLYIENQLPDIPIFLPYQDNIVIGTDSLASNDSLSILSEVKTIAEHYPKIPLKNILQWATSNGAMLFGLEDNLGSFEVGKAPGFMHIEAFDTRNRTLPSTVVKQIAM